ncbi:hypothetical protein AB0H43_32750 [Hamadaea sp. NPDC050747]|uniref:hypothetical protein n=1 Tax=Hamadaea sp. NPDC050747 TaxID=3155789 RepID=UPI0034108015
MITADQAMNQINRAVGAIVRPLGFPGSRGVWTRVTGEGIAAVGTTRSVMSFQGTVFVQVAISAVPRSWWEYRNHQAVQRSEPPIAYDASAVTYDIGFVEARLRPERAFYHMKIPAGGYRTVPQDEVDHAVDLLTTAAGILAPMAIDLVRPGRYLAEMRADPSRGIGFWEPFIVLLADEGPSDELDDAIDEICAAYAERGADRPDDVIAYARARAADVERG